MSVTTNYSSVKGILAVSSIGLFLGNNLNFHVSFIDGELVLGVIAVHRVEEV